MNTQDQNPNEGVERRLDIVIRLLAAQATRGMLQKEAIVALANAGLEIKEVADILRVSSNQVSVAVYQAKKASKAKERKAG